jgi:hypothetical protein
MIELLSNHEDGRKMGERARQVFQQQAGATSRSIDTLREILDIPAHPPETIQNQRSAQRPA